MKNFIKINIFSFLLLGFVSASFVSVATGAEIESAHMIELINSIRVDPLSHAERLGYDRVTLAESLPWLKPTYKPYVTNAFLSARAAAHNSLDGTVPEPAISLDTDYLRIGETGGVVSFFNFMPWGTAAAIIVDNLFRADLDVARTAPRYILTDEFSFAGAAFEARANLPFGEYLGNGYVATVCLGSDRLISEVQVLTMINQLRHDPSRVKTFLGSDLNNLIQGNWFVLNALYGSYGPLFWDDALSASARAGSFFAVNGTYPQPLIGPLSLPERVSYYGYGGSEIAESTVIVDAPKKDTARTVLNISYMLMFDELKRYPENSLLFSAEFEDSGLGIHLLPGLEADKAVVTLDAGKKVESSSDTVRIYGVVYCDEDENHAYTPAEEKAGQLVNVFEGGMLINSVVTDNAGHFTLSLAPDKLYGFVTGEGDSLAVKEISLGSNAYLELVTPKIQVSNP